MLLHDARRLSFRAHDLFSLALPIKVPQRAPALTTTYSGLNNELKINLPAVLPCNLSRAQKEDAQALLAKGVPFIA